MAPASFRSSARDRIKRSVLTTFYDALAILAEEADEEDIRTSRNAAARASNKSLAVASAEPPIERDRVAGLLVDEDDSDPYAEPDVDHIPRRANLTSQGECTNCKEASRFKTTVMSHTLKNCDRSCAHKSCRHLPPHLCSYNGKILCPFWLDQKSPSRDRERPTSPHPRKDHAGTASDAALEDRLAVANRNSRKANLARLEAAAYASGSDDANDAVSDDDGASHASSGRLYAHLAAVHGRSVRDREESSRAAAVLHSDRHARDIDYAHRATLASRFGYTPPDSDYDSEVDADY